MSRRRQQIAKSYRDSKADPEPAGLTFRAACSRLWAVIKMRILPSEYLGKKCFIKNKAYNIEGETLDFFFIKAFPKRSFPKIGNKYKIK